MSNSFFYLQVEKTEKNAEFIEKLETFAIEHKKQIYVIDRPLGDNKYNYDYKDALVLLIPNHKIIFIDIGENESDFSEYVDDFIEDLGSISDKFRYKDSIGRPRSWRKSIIYDSPASELPTDTDQLLSEHELTDDILKRKCELVISLLTGSINDIDTVSSDVPQTLLDKVKQKILLFDGDQTRFVYQQPENKRITIQGLSGTGKTELLLHKLKEIYTANPDSKVIFTCHNKILADNLKKRIPDFFDFMKVEEQIKWHERLWCVNAWGSQSNINSGAYSYISYFYDIGFSRYNPWGSSFDDVCKKAIEEIKALNIEKYAFDYMLIDESQDFPESFFALCELVTKGNVYVAGDIFQSIFDNDIIGEIEPDYLLSKCYRTDPKTLMFAHALGMGLFETPKLRWLKDDEWKACGYLIQKGSDRTYTLSREPLRRFEDLESEDATSVELVETNKDRGETSDVKIIEIIRSIREKNPTVTPDDIGVIFIDKGQYVYASADRLEIAIPREFDWQVNKAYETKEKVKGTLFVSNRNNVKGLEFPFVICVTRKINNSRNYRNALYMVLTRSFLKTYLLTSKDINKEITITLDEELQHIVNNGAFTVTSPTEKEKEEMASSFKQIPERISFYDFTEDIFNELEVIKSARDKLRDVIKTTVGESFDSDAVYEIAEFNYRRMIKG